MAGGQMIGAIVAPLTVALFLGASGSHQDLPHTLWKLCYEILLPLVEASLRRLCSAALPWAAACSASARGEF